MRIWNALVFALLSLTVPTPATAAGVNPVLVGYRLGRHTIAGGAITRISAEPIWVSTYTHLDITYKLTGSVDANRPVLSLRPGSVGPVTPRAQNPENPFANGSITPVVLGRDLQPDSKTHELTIDLTPLMKAAQADQLIFTVPRGATLLVESLRFVAMQDKVPCLAWAASAPDVGSARLSARAPLRCGTASATSLRGNQPILIDAHGPGYSQLALSLAFFSPALTNYVASRPSSSGEMTDPSLVCVRLHYTNGDEEEFPLAIATRRHALVNGAPQLYAVAVDPKRTLLSVAVEDKSPHIQLFLYAAALSTSRMPDAADTTDIPAAASITRSLEVSSSPFFRIASAESGSAHSPAAADYHAMQSANGEELTLSIANPTAAPLHLTVQFPVLGLRSKAGHVLWHVLPQKVANISDAPVDVAADYGPDMLLQFLDVFSPSDNSGMGVIVEDSFGQDKSFHLRANGPEAQVAVSYDLHLKAGESVALPSVKLVRHGRDWHAGFAAYRQWLASWYKPRGRPESWLDSAFYARRDYPVGGSGLLFDEARNRYTFPALIRDSQQVFGGIDLIDISGWALSDKYGRVGDYGIELSTPTDLRDNIAAAHRLGIRTGLYFEGYLIDKNSRIGAAKRDAWQIRDPEGKGLWWPGGSPELFASPFVPEWRDYLSHRISDVARDVAADAVYLDEFGCGKRRDYAPQHNAVGQTMIQGEIAMAKDVRTALDEAGQNHTIVYAECLPVDAAAPYFDALFDYSLPSSQPTAYDAKLNLWRFAFPRTRRWDMLTAGVQPHLLSTEDFRLALWNGDGVWLKGRSDTWYGNTILTLLRRERPFLLAHTAAFAGEAEPLIASPDDRVLINRFSSSSDTVYTLFNRSFGTVHLRFQGATVSIAPRDVAVLSFAHGRSHLWNDAPAADQSVETP